jgi:hypothetical protein
MHSPITETLATILILLSLIKLAVVLVNPRAWLGFVKRFYANPQVASVVALVVAGVILLLLILSGLDIVQILAVSLFVVCLIVVGIVPYAPHILAWIEAQDMQQLIKQQWLYGSVWLALLIWGAYMLLV